MAIAVHQSFSEAASHGPVKMLSSSCPTSVYLRLKNTFLDFYTDETKETKRGTLSRSLSADSAISKGTRGREAAMSASTRSPSPSACEVESVKSVQSAQSRQDLPQRPAAPSAKQCPQDLPRRPTVPSAKVPGAELPVLRVEGPAASQPKPCRQTSSSESSRTISLVDALPAGENSRGACTKDAAAPGRLRAGGRKADLSKFKASAGADVTTVMVRGIPCSLQKNCLMEIMDQAGLEGKYDFFYLPMAGQAKGNLGYAFVNFVHPMYANICAAAMHGLSLDPARSAKICTISAADVQGFGNLKKHFRKTAVSHSKHGPVFPKVQ